MTQKISYSSAILYLFESELDIENKIFQLLQNHFLSFPQRFIWVSSLLHSPSNQSIEYSENFYAVLKTLNQDQNTVLVLDETAFLSLDFYFIHHFNEALESNKLVVVFLERNLHQAIQKNLLSFFYLKCSLDSSTAPLPTFPIIRLLTTKFKQFENKVLLLEKL